MNERGEAGDHACCSLRSRAMISGRLRRNLFPPAIAVFDLRRAACAARVCRLIRQPRWVFGCRQLSGFEKADKHLQAASGCNRRHLLRTSLGNEYLAQQPRVEGVSRRIWDFHDHHRQYFHLAVRYDRLSSNAHLGLICNDRTANSRDKHITGGSDFTPSPSGEMMRVVGSKRK